MENQSENLKENHVEKVETETEWIPESEMTKLNFGFSRMVQERREKGWRVAGQYPCPRPSEYITHVGETRGVMVTWERHIQ